MELDYDGDTNDRSQYCQHGTFIGSWWGPDYLCWACEEGLSVYQVARAQVCAGRRDLSRKAACMSDVILTLFKHSNAFKGMINTPECEALLKLMSNEYMNAQAMHKQAVHATWALREVSRV
jgi:hypothetical protein